MIMRVHRSFREARLRGGRAQDKEWTSLAPQDGEWRTPLDRTWPVEAGQTWGTGEKS
ncbi:hypothetical protein GCM10009801_08500 [Streptomyces albiaxialis]|uniref:Uncharacterized protein n=1 Tax=Streptomyces albiaxialis TaxID=329523 RepID=A0ABN2VJQ7_9ACTN